MNLGALRQFFLQDNSGEQESKLQNEQYHLRQILSLMELLKVMGPFRSLWI